MALDSEGRIWGWGNNEYNQISPEKVDRISTPQEIMLNGASFHKNDEVKVTKIAATSTQAIVLAKGTKENCKSKLKLSAV